jgi:hypothetical protein
MRIAGASGKRDSPPQILVKNIIAADAKFRAWVVGQFDYGK